MWFSHTAEVNLNVKCQVSPRLAEMELEFSTSVSISAGAFLPKWPQ